MNNKFLLQYPIGPSNSTTAEGFNNLKPSEVYITVQDISSRSVTLRDAPGAQRISKGNRAQASVVASLDRSIKDNAEIWSELSKH
jgi:hypothetical protein